MPTDPLGLVGQVLLGRYRVDGPIAQGGMGVVYRGHDARLRRPVCIKIFHHASGSEAIVRTSYEHFVQEAYALSQLSHPHTLRIYDFGHLEDESRAPFQVSELLEGGTLAQWVRREGPRSAGEMLELLEPVAGALSEAHARGIIHRDIKPSNIFLALLGARRVAKLGDFGIAKTPGERPRAPLRPGEPAPPVMRLYSPGWAAPEQLRGEAAAAATDVFSLGLVVAFVLGGRPLFSTTSEEENVEERKQSDAHVALRLAQFRLAPELAEVIGTACRAIPAERYDTVDLLVSALREAVQTVVRRGDVAVDLLSGSRESPTWEEPRSVATSSLVLPASSTPPPSESEPPSAPHAMRNFLRQALAQERGQRVISCSQAGEHLVFGRRLVVRGLAGTDTFELGGDAAPFASAARVRVTFLPSRGPGPRINVKGLNCFVAKGAARPSPAVDVEDDMELAFLAPDRRRMDGMRCLLGKVMEGQHVYTLGRETLAISGAPLGSALFDLGPGRELLFIHSGSAAVRAGGRP